MQAEDTCNPAAVALPAGADASGVDERLDHVISRCSFRVKGASARPPAKSNSGALDEKRRLRELRRIYSRMAQACAEAMGFAPQRFRSTDLMPPPDSE
jgi:hypothetical protein